LCSPLAGLRVRLRRYRVARAFMGWAAEHDDSFGGAGWAGPAGARDARAPQPPTSCVEL